MIKKLMRLALGVLFFATLAHAQATVNETLETVTLYVDAVNGTDSNPGTQGAPLQTIGKAITLANTNNQLSIGTKIIVNAGTYRESIAITYNNKMTSLPITIEAATTGTAILSGADIFTGWSPSAGNASIYTVPWTKNYGFCAVDTQPGAPYQAPIMLRRELVFINGALMTQVLDLAQMAFPGTFFVDDPNQTMYVWPPAGVDINAATVEIGTRSPEVSITKYSNFVLRGMTVQYDNACHNSSAVYVAAAATNILIDTDTMQWNNAKGMNLRTTDPTTPVQNITVKNSQFLHNGETGATDFEITNTLWEDDTFAYNNWRGSLGSYYSWDASGMYFSDEHNQVANNLTALFNMGNGIHWDTDNVNDVATGTIAESNLLNGIFFEKDEGPFTLTGSTVAGNMPQGNITQGVGGGIIIRNSEGIMLESNTIFGNGNSQLAVVGEPGGLPIANWATGVSFNLVSSKLTFNQNVMESTSATAYVFSDGWLGGNDWAAYIGSPYSSTNNTWWSTQGNLTPFIVPAPSSATKINFAGWQTATLQDMSGSTYQQPIPDPSLSYVAPTPDAEDYWLVTDYSTYPMGSDGSASFIEYAIPVGAFTGTINLALVGVSDTPGLSGTISTNSINETGSAKVILTAATSVPAGTYQATVVNNSGALTHAVTFSIIVADTSARITPGTVEFPPTQTGTSSSPLLATLTNYGQASLGISNITTSSQWSQTNTCGSSVAAGQSCTFSVTFKPNAALPILGTMIVTDTDPSSPQTVNLTGTGTGSPQVTLAPQWLAFGTVPVGTSTTMTSVLTNTGIGTLDISSMVFSGANASDYAQSNTCGSAVVAGATCSISVVFTPAATGLRSGTLTITDNTSTGSQAMGLTGMGSAPSAKLTPTSVTFSNQVIGTSSAAKAFTLKNSGAAALAISGISITGSGATAYTETNTCGSSVAAFGQCTISVIFNPKSAGILAGSLVVTDNSSNGSQSATLSGTGITSALTVTPTSVVFAPQNVGARSAGSKVTVTNLSSAAITIGSVTISGTNAGDFSDGNACGVTLGAGRSCNVTAYFTPTAAGARAAVLNIGAIGVTLTGTGTQPVASLSVTSLNFGTVKYLTKSAVMNVTLTNTGTGTLTINQTNITGTNGPWFAQTNTCGTSVAVGASCTISVTATPKGRATGTGTLNVKDNAPNSPQIVTLTVTGN